MNEKEATAFAKSLPNWAKLRVYILILPIQGDHEALDRVKQKYGADIVNSILSGEAV